MKTVVDLINESFSAYKSKVAIRIYDKSWSYGDLHSLTDQIVTFLLEKGMKKGDRVVSLMNKSIFLYAAIIGILRSGGVYVPLDTRAPSLRLAKMVEDISPLVVFIDHYYVDHYRNSQKFLKRNVETIFLSEKECRYFRKLDFQKTHVRNFSDLPSISPEDLALVLFTSGSTGMPKGAMISHGGLYNIINWTIQHFHYGPCDVGSALNATAFDMSLSDMLPVLCSGGSLGVYPEEVLFPKDILQLTYNYGITKMMLVPSTLNSLVKSGLIRPEFLGNMTDIILGGETIPVNILIEIMNKLPHTKFHNGYGPTETTMYVAKHTFQIPPKPDQKLLPIGFPIAGNSFILDNVDFPGEENRGELIIMGPQVGKGYWNEPAKTEVAFGINDKGGRFYRTGDIASFDARVGYFIHGRKDNQIKVGGYRIELGEIEHMVSGLDFIRENVAIPVWDRGKIESLKLVYSAERDYDKEIWKYLNRNLPNYMIPKYFLRLEELPKNKSNKVDRALLKEKYGRT
jgi:amino acid adenylation domain-containing protein